ncbi:hypothetical protein TorRG33x02_008690 [Trema orientale]|uniref:Uncharacterized protein n=1 Tax=Trema orientale TaxID=63057 RepID=A0A2P5G0T9_TREOI|nr:hypothetical protein TorRG33x02_008690 [Trema orientale]
MITGCSDISRWIWVSVDSSSLINREEEVVVALLVAVVMGLRLRWTMSFLYLDWLGEKKESIEREVRNDEGGSDGGMLIQFWA